MKQRYCMLLFLVALIVSSLAFAQTTVNNSVQGVSPGVDNPPANTVNPTTVSNTQSNGTNTGVVTAIPDMKIGPGDMVRVKIFGDTEYQPEVRLDGNGNAELPPLGLVHLAGLTPSQAGAMLRTKMLEGGFYKDPRISVQIIDYATQGVSVLGEVQKPGVYVVQGERHLFDLISAANGFTPRAGTRVSVTRRDQSDHPILLNISHDPAASAASNIMIMPGDTIIVSSAGVVYVVGDVAKPSGFFMDNENLTMLQAVALAGGVNSTAALNDSKIIRKTSNGRTEVPVRLNDVLQAKMQDMPLQADDIVFVPKSAGKNAAQRGMAAILQAATGVVIYSRR